MTEHTCTNKILETVLSISRNLLLELVSFVYLRIFFGEGNNNPPPVFLPGGSRGWRSLVGYSLWGSRVGHE